MKTAKDFALMALMNYQAGDHASNALSGLVEWAILEFNKELIKENERLREGNLTSDEFHNFCHNKEKSVGVSEFCQGCEDYQMKLFGCSPIKDLKSKLRRYEYNEETRKEPKTFAKEIETVHPLNKEGVDVEYEMALKLVGERKDKYELVDLVHWLLVHSTNNIFLKN